jgi:hypothetical protein
MSCSTRLCACTCTCACVSACVCVHVKLLAGNAFLHFFDPQANGAVVGAPVLTAHGFVENAPDNHYKYMCALVYQRVHTWACVHFARARACVSALCMYARVCTLCTSTCVCVCTSSLSVVLSTVCCLLSDI